MQKDIDDIAFTRALLDDLANEVSVDADRIYATGLSNGAIMAYHVASELSDRIAAIAPIGGPMMTDTCRPKYPVSVIHFHGTADRFAPLEGGYGKRANGRKGVTEFNSVNHSIQNWVKANGCRAEPEVVRLPDKAEDGMRVSRKTWGEGREGAEVVLIEIEGGGHTRPGKTSTVEFLGESTHDISANDLMWAFFQKHSRKTAKRTQLVAKIGDYDPAVVAKSFKPKTIDLTVHDESRDRDIPIKVYLPASKNAEPIVLFSHGLGGSREGSSYLGRQWAARGYVAVFLQHPGSDNSVWKGVPPRERMAALKKAASLQNLILRVKDVPAVIDQLEKWCTKEDHPLAGRMNLKQIGMSGHSFGAQTTQAVSGQSAGLAGPRFSDPRIKAAIAFSPSSPRRGDPKKSFGSVKVPWLLMTGTKDTAPIGGQTVETRLAVFPALPDGDHYELVLHNAEHSAFSDRALPGDSQPRNPNHHRVILALSTAFWDTYLRDQKHAKVWLNGPAAKNVMESQDRWQRK